MEFDLKIAIPKGRKPGKYLQKVWNDIPDLSALVNSLDLCPKEFKTKAEYFSALKYCHSCQSHDNTMDLFYEAYSKLPNIRFVGLIDLINGKQIPVARCLVNVKSCTFAPIYGKNHFMLEQRLLFAGYEPGEIATNEEIQEVIKIEEFPIYSPNKYPKSKVKTKKLTFEYPKKPEYHVSIQESLLRKAKENLEDFLNEVPDACVIKTQKIFNSPLMFRKNSYEFKRFEKAEKEDWIDHLILTDVHRWTKSLNENRKEWSNYHSKKRSYKKAYEKYQKVGKIPKTVYFKNTFTIETEYRAPITEDYYFVEKSSTFEIRTTLYLDSTKSYIDGMKTIHAGWYNKKC